MNQLRRRQRGNIRQSIYAVNDKSRVIHKTRLAIPFIGVSNEWSSRTCDQDAPIIVRPITFGRFPFDFTSHCVLFPW